jgi:hypothetical protein
MSKIRKIISANLNQSIKPLNNSINNNNLIKISSNLTFRSILIINKVKINKIGKIMINIISKIFFQKIKIFLINRLTICKPNIPNHAIANFKHNNNKATSLTTLK